MSDPRPPSPAERAAERLYHATGGDLPPDAKAATLKAWAAIIAEEYAPLVEALTSIADFDCASPDGYKSMRDLRAALRIIEGKARAALGSEGKVTP